jgi:hypothetical protein
MIRFELSFESNEDVQKDEDPNGFYWISCLKDIPDTILLTRLEPYQYCWIELDRIPKEETNLEEFVN